MNNSITLQQGMTYRQVQQAFEANWPLLTIVLFHPTPGLYKAPQHTAGCFLGEIN
ncbi:hypothetical protein [Spirosoma gilvum]